MRRFGIFWASLLLLGLGAAFIVACRDVPLVRVDGLGLTDDCRLVGYTFGWLVAPEHDERPEGLLPFQPMRQQDENMLTDMLRLSIEADWDELSVEASEICRDVSLGAATQALDWYWCRKEPLPDIKELLIAYQAREIRCASATPALGTS